MDERWIDIEGTNGLYSVSSAGFARRNSPYRRNVNHIILKPCLDLRGYPFVGIMSKPKKIHRLVAEAFIPKIIDKPHVNHIDGNKLNNSVSNLEWCTHTENIRHAFRIGLYKDSTNKRLKTIPIKTHCLRGHAYAVDRSDYGVDGRRNCRICARERTKAYLKIKRGK